MSVGDSGMCRDNVSDFGRTLYVHVCVDKGVCMYVSFLSRTILFLLRGREGQGEKYRMILNLVSVGGCCSFII